MPIPTARPIRPDSRHHRDARRQRITRVGRRHGTRIAWTIVAAISALGLIVAIVLAILGKCTAQDFRGWFIHARPRCSSRSWRCCSGGDVAGPRIGKMTDSQLIPKHLDFKCDKQLEIDWQDGTKSIYPLSLLRSMCPCASCREHREKESQKKTLLKILPGNYSGEIQVVHAELVGNYCASHRLVGQSRHGDLFISISARHRSGEKVSRLEGPSDAASDVLGRRGWSAD